MVSAWFLIPPYSFGYTVISCYQPISSVLTHSPGSSTKRSSSNKIFGTVRRLFYYSSSFVSTKHSSRHALLADNERTLPCASRW